MGGGDAAEDDGVIAGGNARFNGAFEVGDGTVENRRTVDAGRPIDAVEAILAAFGEAIGKALLPGFEDVDGKAVGGFEVGDNVGLLIDADEHDGRGH